MTTSLIPKPRFLGLNSINISCRAVGRRIWRKIFDRPIPNGGQDCMAFHAATQQDRIFAGWMEPDCTVRAVNQISETEIEEVYQ